MSSNKIANGAEVRAALREAVAPGVTGRDLDGLAKDEIAKRGGQPTFVGYGPGGRPPYPGAICYSVNDHLVHGIPGSRALKEGDIVSIDPSVVKALQDDAFIPVVSPIGFGENNESYNINADVVAAKLATVLQAEKLLMLTNIRGVLDKAGDLLPELTPREIDQLCADGTISGGMIPKIAGALDAAKSGVNAVHIIDGRVPHAMLLEVLTEQAFGTMIRSH